MDAFDREVSPERVDRSLRTGWPHRLRDFAERWSRAIDPREAKSHRDELWVLLYSAMALCVRSRARAIRSIAPEDLRDIAGQKALDLIRQIEAGAWEPSRSTPEQVRAYVFAAAGNALTDLVRSKHHHVLRIEDREGAALAEDEVRLPATLPPQESSVDRGAFVATILDCLSRLTARSRRIWYLRILLEMSSAQIAAHPGVRMSPGGVDVALFRARQAMRGCLSAHGIDGTTIPPGTFVALWEAVEAEDRT